MSKCTCLNSEGKFPEFGWGEAEREEETQEFHFILNQTNK